MIGCWEGEVHYCCLKSYGIFYCSNVWWDHIPDANCTGVKGEHIVFFTSITSICLPHHLLVIDFSNSVFSTRALIAIRLQFLYVAPLPPITGKIPERIICSILVFFSFPINCLYLCTILVVPSQSALFVPKCTNIDPPWPCPNVLSTFSVTCCILAPGRQTTSSPLLNVFLFLFSMPPQSLPQSSSSMLHLPGR